MATNIQLELEGTTSRTRVVSLELSADYHIDLNVEPMFAAADQGTLYDLDIKTGTNASAVSCTPDHTTETFTATAHGLNVGDTVHFAASVLPTGLSAATNYYVCAVTANTFQVSATSAKSAVQAITSNGTTVTFARRDAVPGMRLSRVVGADGAPVWKLWGAPTTAGVYEPVIRLHYQDTSGDVNHGTLTVDITLSIAVHAAVTQPTTTETVPDSQGVLDALELQVDILKKQAELAALQAAAAAATATTMDTAYIDDDFSVELNFDLLTRSLSIPDSGLAEAAPGNEPLAADDPYLMVLHRGERVKLAIGLMKRDELHDLSVGTIKVTWKMYEPEAKTLTLISGAPTTLGTGHGDRRYSVTAYVDPTVVNAILPRGTGLDRTGVDGYLQVEVQASGGSPLTLISHSAKVKIYRDQ